MSHQVIRRDEMLEATLELGGASISLADYATTGLVGTAIAPRGNGKTNAGLLIGEQLAAQGWVSIFIDPENELESLYGAAISGPAELERCLTERNRSIVVVKAPTPSEFIQYGEVILAVADAIRKPLFLMFDEGQCFSATRQLKGCPEEREALRNASDLVNAFVERGRKRAVDIFITAHRFTGSLHRSVLANMNLKLIGCQEDPTAWSNLAAQFRATGIRFSDLNALAPGEFICFSRTGAEKVRMPMAKALAQVAPRSRPARRALPATFSEWDRAMRAIPDDRLHALTDPVVSLLGAIAGLSSQQMLVGCSALADELESRG